MIKTSKFRNILLFIFLITLALSCTPVGDHGEDSEDDSESDDDDDIHDPPSDDDDDDDSTGDDDDDDADDDDDDVYQPPDGFQMIFYDIGQGDATLVRFPGGSTMLIDGGPNEAGKDVIVPHFDKIHLKTLDYIVLSHPHSDHCGGLDEVIDEVEVGEVWENGQTKDTMSYDEFSNAVDDYDITRKKVNRGYSDTIDGCLVEVIYGDEGWTDHNSNSLVMTIDCEDTILLLTGDSTEESQDDLISMEGNALASDIVKVPHHGSPDRDSSFAGFVSPEIATFSCGEDNPYGHPAGAVITEWEVAGAEIYRTDIDGTITVDAKDGNLSVQTAN